MRKALDECAAATQLVEEEASGYSMAHYAHKLIYVQRGGGREEGVEQERNSFQYLLPSRTQQRLAWTKDTAAFLLAPSSD